jgi:nitroreductase
MTTTMPTTPTTTKTTTTPKDVLAALHRRYATKQFDPSKKIAPDVWEGLEDVLVLSASSYGMQPYCFITVKNPETRQALFPHAHNQRQVLDASHFVVFAAKQNISEADVDEFIQRTATARSARISDMAPYRQMIVGDLVTGPRSKIIAHWAERQAYLALGNLLTSTAILGIDACPMEGIVPPEFDRILGIDPTEYQTIVACAVGYRQEGDRYATLAKVRKSKEELFLRR